MNRDSFTYALKAQRLLNDALQYWLYGSLSSFSLKNSLCHRYYVNAQPLTKCAVALQESGTLSMGLKLQLLPRKVSTIQYSETLTLFYRRWEQYLSQVNSVHATMPKAQNYQSWLAEGKANSRYRPVYVLRRILNRRGPKFFKRAIIHGSIATLDDTPGFSDMDLAFVVRATVLKDAKKLLQLRKLAAEILTLTYSFDPFMHHGPYYFSEIDLKWYPEAMFPSILFGYGVDLLDNSEELEIGVRPSDYITDQQLRMFERFFESWPNSPFVLKDSYDIEWLLGSAMLLPALYLQRKTGAFYYKRDTFPLAEKDFSTEEWEPIKIASTLRASLGTRPKPPRPLLWLALFLRWPGLLQRWARRQPLSIQRAGKATTALGQDYPQRVLRLLRTMKSKIENTDTFQRTR